MSLLLLTVSLPSVHNLTMFNRFHVPRSSVVGYEPLENTYYFIIRECLERGAVEEAQLVVESMAERNVKLKLRTYEPIFHQLLDKSNVPLLNRIWNHMRRNGILPPSEFFIAMLTVWRDTGEVRAS